jgi:hypothetical protein
MEEKNTVLGTSLIDTDVDAHLFALHESQLQEELENALSMSRKLEKENELLATTNQENSLLKQKITLIQDDAELLKLQVKQLSKDLLKSEEKNADLIESSTVKRDGEPSIDLAGI